MDIDDMSVRASSLLRRAGLAHVSRLALVGTAIIGLALVLVGAWHFWPRANADFVATVEQAGEQEIPMTSDSASSQADIVVDIEGAVAMPGLYTLPADSRVGDAIQAAGGLAADARPGAANLAQKLADGEQVVIPSQADAEQAAQDTSSSAKKGGKININTASATELQKLSGVGPALSERIVEYRESKGHFSSIEDLQNVSGIGETRFANLRDKICV